MEEPKLVVREGLELPLREFFRQCCEPQVVLIRAFAAEIGYQRTLGLIKEVRREAVLQAGLRWQESLVREDSRSDFELFVATLERVLRSDLHRLALEVEELERTDNRLRLKVTRCLWAEIYRELEAEEIGYAYICEPNRALPEAFSAKIRLERTKTLMLGDEYCDHCYIFEER